ncbi:MAG TPA: TldD/PmbA family protein [Rhodobacteraceae bacterium]|nr:TldD/PmbA family protein [Paracoccaceae bacterium]
MNRTLESLSAALLNAARAAGAEAADAIVISSTSISTDVLNGRLEHAERSEGTDIGLRVLIGQRQACVSASDTSADTITTMAERAVIMARAAPVDDSIGLATPGQLAQNRDAAALDLFDPADEPDPSTLQETAERAEAAALAVKGISQVESASTGYGRRLIHLAASNGFSGGYQRSSIYSSCVAITGTGTDMERDYYGDGRVYASDLESPEHIGKMAAERTLARAHSRQPPSGTYPVLYDERISSSLISHLLAAVNGSAIVRGSSWLRDALGQQILPTGLSLTEDPLRPRTSGSRPFDAEGLPSARRNIIDNGVLTGWTLDLATARKLNMQSTGNASRGPSAPPSPGISNVSLTQSEKSRNDLIRDMGTGLLITSLIGSTINPTTGDYSRGAAGFWVEGGEIRYPVNECTIAGNLRDMLLTLTPANDARPHLSRVVPSLLVEGLTIAGA